MLSMEPGWGEPGQKPYSIWSMARRLLLLRAAARPRLASVARAASSCMVRVRLPLWRGYMLP